MKLSSYYKQLGWNVELKLDYENLDTYDKVTISKVFMDTEIPFEPEDKSMKIILFLIYQMFNMVAQDFTMINLQDLKKILNI